jgi:hypothetical protein
MDYECDGSGAKSKDAVSFLKDIGFKGGSKTDYNLNTILSSLNNSRPVIIIGYAIKKYFLGISFLYSLSSGHSWVIDGYLRRSRQVTVTVTTSIILKNKEIRTTSTRTYTEYSPYYLHNNWGNYAGNGYFVEGSFNYNNNKSDENVFLPSITRSNEAYNYQFGIDIFPEIYY